nr:hypothetical protein [Tanacetum cinerariifolium]
MSSVMLFFCWCWGYGRHAVVRFRDKKRVNRMVSVDCGGGAGDRREAVEWWCIFEWSEV